MNKNNSNRNSFDKNSKNCSRREIPFSQDINQQFTFNNKIFEFNEKNKLKEIIIKIINIYTIIAIISKNRLLKTMNINIMKMKIFLITKQEMTLKKKVQEAQGRKNLKITETVKI